MADGYSGPDPRGSDWRTCEHEWQPVTLALDVQLLDDRGRYTIGPIPNPDKARVYLVCLRCASHTYMATAFRFRLHGTEDQVDGEWPPDESA